MRGKVKNKNTERKTSISLCVPLAYLIELHSLLHKKSNAKPQNKTIHPKIESRSHASVASPAQNRRSRGTLGSSLSAAWSPTWHGSQFPIAQDPFLNTADTPQFVKARPSKKESTPAVADFRYRAPLSPRLVWPRFTALHCYRYIIPDFHAFCNTFLKIHNFFSKLKFESILLADQKCTVYENA